MTMTLQEAHDWLVEVRKRNAVNASLDNLDDHDAEAVIQALDAHIAAMGEPIGFIQRSVAPPYDYWPESFVLGEPQEDESETEHWEPLYARAPTSGDWDKVREVIANLRTWKDEGTDSMADRLATALPESQP